MYIGHFHDLIIFLGMQGGLGVYKGGTGVIYFLIDGLTKETFIVPAKTPEAIERKINNRKSKKDMGKEIKIAELGGTPIAVQYGEPLEETVRKERTDYLFDLMYPKRHVFKSSGRTKMTEAERKEKGRKAAAKRYRKAKAERGEVVRGKAPTGSMQVYSPWYTMWIAAKNRASKKGLPFDIEREDVRELVVDLDYCPVLGIKLNWDNDKLLDDSPTLDKIIPELGYVKGNIAVISNKANRIKTDANLEEIGKVWCWLKKQV
jgi:hypothetical protein